MSTTARSDTLRARRTMLSKVPEVTVWFWVIKILCTTVGESFADWVNVGLGYGLVTTSVLFTIALAMVLAVQLWLTRYVPFAYWLTVVVLSVAGTLYTDILTDSLGVALPVSTAVFAIALGVVFAIWYAAERTLSIHSIVTTGRELFYWLAVLVTFALGTAAGDWTIALTGWGPGTSVLLPATLILLIVLGWRLGANAVLSFWLAYILTRPLGANLGDWLASPLVQHGLGLGYAITSVIFLMTILAAVGYLSVSGVDVIDEDGDDGPARHHETASTARVVRERLMLGYFALVAGSAAVVLIWAAGQPHTAPANAAEEEGNSATESVTLAPGQAVTNFPPADVNALRQITQDTLTNVQAGNHTAATARVTDLETVWDQDQTRLQPMDPTGWAVLDGQIDDVLGAVRSSSPDQAAEIQSLTTLLTNLQ
ncbi:hypothetical protein ACT17_12065 [Mycolicibacterium conceptionense]|uniref:Membrane-anchored protein n=1 Tax=Mycolicibacterium conceptionense TaxID=451644 RepID=A0A0J8UAF7_9MYCO|nr:hypothetical protein ACT17_12065 [Mycolicibacterium conceptionense]